MIDIVAVPIDLGVDTLLPATYASWRLITPVEGNAANPIF
jgi:hypothetical protein